MTLSSTPSNGPGLKQITIRWDEDFWEFVSIESTKRRTSVQALVTEAVRKYLGLPEASDSSEQAASGLKKKTA